jgi:hypothetical protein
MTTHVAGLGAGLTGRATAPRRRADGAVVDAAAAR